MYITWYIVREQVGEEERGKEREREGDLYIAKQIIAKS